MTFSHPSYKYTGFGKMFNEFQQTHSFGVSSEVSQSLITVVNYGELIILTSGLYVTDLSCFDDPLS